MDFCWVTWTMALVLEILHVVCAHDCESSESTMCREDLDNLMSHKQHHNFIDDEYLNKMCIKQLKALQCVKTYAESCLPEEQQKIFQILTQGSDQFFYDFCSEESLMRKEYKKHSTCIKSVSSHLDKCTKEYEFSQQLLDENETDAKILKEKTCCIYFENIQCSSNATSEQCGEDAAKVITKLWTSLGGTYLNHLCEPYAKDYFKDCSPISGSSRLFHPTNVLYLLAVLGSTILYSS